jgi:uncharacterized protein YbbK (DUF523 family)
MKVCSACLVGIECKWDGKGKRIPKIKELFLNNKVLPLCAEQLGGLPTPRPCSGILNGVGADVLDGKCIVVNEKGENITKQFVKGAHQVLALIKDLNINEAILKKKSPCCGVGKTWQMSEVNHKFVNKLVEGDGVLTALLKRNGIKVISEEDI